MLSHPNLPTAVSLHVAWGGPRCDGQTRGTTTPHMGRDLASAPWALPLWTPGETSGPLFFTAKQEQEKERERKKKFYLCIYLFGWFGREFFKPIYLGRVISRRWLQPRDILVKCICLIYFLKKCLFLSKRVTKTTEEKKKKRTLTVISGPGSSIAMLQGGGEETPVLCPPHFSVPPGQRLGAQPMLAGPLPPTKGLVSCQGCARGSEVAHYDRRMRSLWHVAPPRAW